MESSLAERLQQLRKENGYSQEQLADALNVSRQAVSKWECGAASPDTENLIALAKLYSCSIDAIVFGSEPPRPTNESETKSSEPERPETKPHTRCHDKTRCHEKQAHPCVGIISAITVFASAIAYILCGTLLNAWHPSWIVFFAIPIIPSLVDAIIKKEPHIFCLPVLVVVVYLLLGCQWNLWHPWWVIFLLIPVYYALLNIGRKDQNGEEKKEEQDKNDID